jgi:hypothetical protein
MKFGFDIHGVLDTHPAVYSAMTQALVAAGHEVHVITGAVWNEEMGADLKSKGIVWTHFFSITTHHEEKGDVEVRWVDGKPWMDADVWNETKAVYCREENIVWLIDDSPVYGKYFDDANIYVLQRDPREVERWNILGATGHR